MLNAIEYSIKEWQNYLAAAGEPKFRAKQIFAWLHKGADFDDMTNLPKGLIEKLKAEFTPNSVRIHNCYISQKDDTRKYIFALADGNIIEGVLMSYKYGNTICISTQVGCRMNCAFCASGIDGLVRNLTAGEILGEVLAVNTEISERGERQITNIVLMGSGEPLDNYDNVIKFINLVNDTAGINISKRNISLSTCGICDKIYSLADDANGVNLTISLHAATDIIRQDIMPINKKYKINDIIKACKYYFERSGRRIIFEYSMISGVNDSLQCADDLAALVRGMPCHINIINLNYVKEKGLKGSRNERVQEFIKALEAKNVSVTLRRTMGGDVDGACGQLRRSIIEGGNEGSL